MLSLYDLNYKAHVAEPDEDVEELLRELGIRLSREAYVIWAHDENDEPAVFVVVDRDRAFLIGDEELYVMRRTAIVPPRSFIIVIYDVSRMAIDVLFTENDADYYMIPVEGVDDMVGFGFIHEQLGARHFFVPLSDVIEVSGAGRDKRELVKAVEEVLKLPFEMDPDDVRYVFIKPREEDIERLMENDADVTTTV